MCLLRLALVWLILFVQVWTPVLAQTLPIEVDRGAGGRPPFVTVGPNGVPIVNIAPPGAGGVSANHYKQFNVGPSGVVLNNSGLGSGSVLAGGVPGNPMLGNSHATTILNQVTTNNPSLLRGLMEVAGHRANVIVANPAGITCDGCGFINSNRGTFTTGTALLGPGGVAGFDITRGRLAFEGQGLQGEPLSRVDLYARAVVLNAAVWANYLDVVAGAADIGYQDGSVTPKEGVGERPSFSIDMGALGSMYANGIRMKGTEAGLGVNMGGNIEAYTGEVHMDANGSLRLQPSAQLHAARLALRGSDINLAGALYADQDVTVTAVNDISVDDLIDAKGNAFLQGRNILLGQSAVATAGLNLHIDAAGQLRSLGTIRADGPVTLQSTGATTLSGGTVSDAGGVNVVSTAGDITFTPSANTRAASGISIRGARDVNLHGEAATSGAITVDAGGKFGSAGKVIVGGPVTLRSATGAVLSGATVSQGSFIDIRSTTGDIDLTSTATAWAAGPINIVGTRDVQLGGATYSAGTINVDAAGQLRSLGQVVAAGPVVMRSAGGDISGETVSENSTIAITSTVGDVKFGKDALTHAVGPIAIRSARDVHLDGSTSSKGKIALDAARDVSIDGTTSSKGEIGVGAGRDVNIDSESTTSSEGSTDVDAGRDVNFAGRVEAEGGDLSIDAGGKVALAKGSLGKASGDVTVGAGGTLTNDGYLKAGKKGVVRAEGGVTNQGDIWSGGDLDVQTPGELTNTGNVYAGVSDKGELALPGNLNLKTDSEFVNRGNAAAGGNATLNGRNLNLAQGKVSASEAVTLTTPGTIDTQKASVSGNAVRVNGKSLSNQKGDIYALGELVLDLADKVDNQGGSLESFGFLRVTGKDFDNRGGKTLGKSVDARLTETITNTAGLIGAEDVVRLQAKRVINSDTKSSDPNTRLGIEGTTVSILGSDRNAPAEWESGRDFADSTDLKNYVHHGSLNGGNSAAIETGSQGHSVQHMGEGRIEGQVYFAKPRASPESAGPVASARSKRAVDDGSLDNTRGNIKAYKDLTISAQTLDNSQGAIYAGNLARIASDSVTNEGGVIRSDGDLRARGDLAGRGKVLAGGDLDVAFRSGQVRHTGEMSAKGNVGIQTPGNLSNAGLISAGKNNVIKSNALNNEASGEILAGARSFFNVQQQVHNAGLIDGGSTHIRTDDLRNVGRLYGDRISLQARNLSNSRATPVDDAGVIASRGDIDFGVERLVNEEDGLIYAEGRLATGGELDADLRATGKAKAVSNESALIEAGGAMTMAAERIDNRNLHFAISEEDEEVLRRRRLYYRLHQESNRRYDKDDQEASQDEEGRLDANLYWLCDETTAMCSKDPAWLDDDPERRLFNPSKEFKKKYPEERYGPPFTYAKGGHGAAGERAPVAFAYDEGAYMCSGDSDCWKWPDKFYYPTSAPIWDVFGVERPSEPPPAPRGCRTIEECDTQKAAHEQGKAAYVKAYLTLNEHILAFNREFNKQLVRDFHIYEVEEVVRENRTASTKPARIISGRDATFDGHVYNDRSQIIAGGEIRQVNGGKIDNLGAKGVRRTWAEGTWTHTYEKGNDRKYKHGPYEGDHGEASIQLAIGTATPFAKLPATGASAPDSSARAGALSPVAITNIPLSGRGFVRTVALPVGVPNNRLYTVFSRPDAPYLVAMDARFLGSRPRLSSDYLLQRLAEVRSVPLAQFRSPREPDAASTLKRLGDGYYEQTLVADQIMSATGQRFVGDYRDNEAQYKALLTTAVEYAQRFGLQVGTPLTAEHMKQLTSNMVWLVKQTVTLPDGSTQVVLVPQVYLVTESGSPQGDRTLISGRGIDIESDGDHSNSGDILARDHIKLAGRNIRNLPAGVIRAAAVDLSAREDIESIGGWIKGGAVKLHADRDVKLTTTTGSAQWQSRLGSGTASVRTYSDFISNVARIDARYLDIGAGRNVAMTAAELAIEGDARISAGKDVNLLTVRKGSGEAAIFGKKHNSEVRTSSEVGTNIQVQGNLDVIAGRNVSARAANVAVDESLSVTAGEDINIDAGQATSYARDELYLKYKKGWGKKVTQHSIESSDQTQAQASTFTADEASFRAGRGVNVRGSNIGTLNDLNIGAVGDVTITAAQETVKEEQYRYKKVSGFGALGGLSHGKFEQTQSSDGVRVLRAPSTVGSVLGGIRVTAGESFALEASDLVAPKGNVAVTAKDVKVVALQETDTEKLFQETRNSGFAITVGSPLLDTFETLKRMERASSKTDSPIMKSLALGAGALKVANTPGLPSAGGGSGQKKEVSATATLTLDWGTSRQTSTTELGATTVAGSTIAAGEELSIVARGAGAESDVTVIGSALSAGKNAVVDAEGDILVEAAANTQYQHTKSSSVDGKIGVGVMAGVSSSGSTGYGFIIKASVAASRGKEDGEDLYWTGSSVKAKDRLTLKSGGNTSFIGASGEGERIITSVGGDLLLQSLQDESHYRSKNESASAGGTFCFGYCTSSFSASYSRGALKSNFAAVTEQAGLRAGDGGFQIDVGNRTSLIGSVIGSSDQAVRDGKSRLSTSTLTSEDIKNKADYKGYQVGLSGGYSASGSGPTGGSDPRSSEGGFAAGAPTFAAAFDSSGSTTYSAISGAEIVIRDAAGQMALTGQASEEMLAALNRDTSDTLNTLSPIFDKEKTEANFAIVQEFQGQAGAFLMNRAKDAQVAEKALADELAAGKPVDAARFMQLLDRVQEAQAWQASGKYGQVLSILSGAAGGNVMAPATKLVQSAAVLYLQGLSATKVKEIADSLGKGPSAEAARGALHGIVGCGGSAGRGASCAAGALGAGAGSVINSLMGSAVGLEPEDIESRRNLVASLAVGIAQGVSLDPATAGTSANIETTNNALQFAAGAAASACARVPAFCSRVITQATDKVVYLAVQSKEGVVYVATAAASALAASTDLVNEWVHTFVSDVLDNDRTLPGRGGEVIQVPTLPPLRPADEEQRPQVLPQPSPPIEHLGTPGLGMHEAAPTITASPMPDVGGAAVLLSLQDPRARIPGGQTVDEFEGSLVGLSPGERVARIKETAKQVADAQGMTKDARLTKINRRDSYRGRDGKIYALDTQHGRFEVVHPKTGKHLGEVDFSMQPSKKADRSQSHDLKVK